MRSSCVPSAICSLMRHGNYVVTGTSAGIGRALTEFILERNEIVVATLRKPSDVDDLVAKYPANLHVLPLDITSPVQISEAFQKVKETFGRIDIVVNNAAISTLGEVESVSDNVARAIFETNFWGTLSMTKAAVSFFREANPPGVGGRLLQMSSMLGQVGFAGAGHYVASKFGS